MVLENLSMPLTKVQRFFFDSCIFDTGCPRFELIALELCRIGVAKARGMLSTVLTSSPRKSFQAMISA